MDYAVSAIEEMSMRKAIIATVVLLIALSSPLSAVVGFCAKMPCCESHEASHDATLAPPPVDCCTSVSCALAPPGHQQTSATVHYAAGAILFSTVSIHVTPPPMPARSSGAIEPSPPSGVGDRLSLLSTFLI
jgi:hypothetical protein